MIVCHVSHTQSAYGQLGLTLGGLGNTLDGVVSGTPSYTPPQQMHQIIKLANGKTVIVPVQPNRGGGLLDVGSLVGGLGLPLGRRKRMAGGVQDMTSPLFGLVG